MKLYFILLLLIGLIAGCEKDEESVQEFTLIGSKFTHDIPDCDNAGNQEMNCTDFIRFIDESRADILVGGDDIVFRLNYNRSGNKIIIEQGEGINYDISFNIQNEQTLIRVEDNSVWQKED